VRRRKTAIFFVVLGVCLIAIAVALNVGWILLNLREVALLVLGIIFFLLLITGVTLNTIFLVREIRKNEQHDAFLNAVTHELKTPIASIRLYLETLKTREVDEAKRQEFYDVMLADSDRLLTTVDQVLTASHTREKKRQMNLGHLDLGALVGESIEIVLKRNHLEPEAIKFTCPAEKTDIYGDRAELEMAFLNLLDNAVKYSEGEPRILVRMKASRMHRADVIIRDSGVGMAGKDLKRIFKRFYRASGLTGTKGNGLGLAIVHNVITKHGGSVRAESRGLGKGSTFIVQLPLS
jgi:signal transduction histidine kinase